MNAKNDYGQLDARFGVVRRAWKRAAALSGLAIVVSEAIGVFTAMLFLDWLYQPLPVVRIGMWAVALAVIAWFFARHVIKPLLRKIPNEQIALYIEEHRTELDGVLITAAEFGKKREKLTGRQAEMIDTVVHEAADRSTRTQVGRVVDLSRLKKYGIGAVAGIAIYLLLSVLFPATFGHHIGRILQPWQTTAEDLARHKAATAAAEALRVTLSKGDTSLPRGTSFDFEATLSKAKPADQAVVLYFRPKAGGDWQKLAMTEIEKINGFQGVLPDVSEDLEFYVACGDVKTDIHKLTVYDPLVVRSLEVTTHYPDYVKQPDRVEKPSPGDVTALIGSTVTLRVLTSTPLKDGQIKWSNGQTAAVTVDPQSKSSATVSFEVKEDATYDYLLTDVNGQQAVSAAPLSVHAIPDTPPTVNVKSPQSPVLTNMLGEINFQVEAGDDFGVESLELVYSRIDAKGDQHDTRVPLPYKPTAASNLPHAVAANYHLALEDINPPLQPNDAIPYHVEAKDAKGQVASSPIGLIIVGYFEHWATWMEPETGNELHNDTNADLMQVLALVWELDNQKTQIKPDELKKRSTEIAGKIEGPDGSLNDFLNLEEHPQLAKVADVINGHIKKGHDLLATADTSAALNQLSIAAAILAGNGIDLDTHVHGSEEQETVVGSHFNSPKITMLEQARLTALSNAAKGKQHDESDQADSADAAATAQEVADLLKQQDALVAHAQALSGAQNPGASKGGADAHDDKDKSQSFGSTKSGAGAAGQPPPSTAAGLAAQQQAVAAQTRAAATAAQAKAADTNNTKLQQAATKTAEAARLMEEAARAFEAGKADVGQDKATQAQTTLHAVGDALQNTDRNQLEAAIQSAATRAAVLLDKQNDLGSQTDTLAKDLGTNKPDQRQERDLQKQAYTQTQLGAETETLNSEINDLNERAAQVGQPEAIRALTEAQRDIKRGQPQVKMSNAVIDLNTASPGGAGDEQKNAEGSLQKIIASLQAGSDALAASRAAQLDRANRVAQEAKKDLNTLLTQAGLPQPKGDQGAGAQGKGDQAQPGAQAGTQPGTQAGTQPGTQPGAQAGTQGGGQPGAQAGTQPGAQPSTMGNGGGDEIRKLAYNLTQLTAVIDNRQLVPQDQVDQLKEMSMDKAELEKKLAVDPKFLQDVSALVGNISGKIEAEMEAKTEASKLFSSQREECPPSYRQFVNKYFEALSQVAPAPGQDKPAASGQP